MFILQGLLAGVLFIILISVIGFVSVFVPWLIFRDETLGEALERAHLDDTDVEGSG